MKVQQEYVFISGNIDPFESITIFDSSKDINQGILIEADENGRVSIKLSPGEYYFSTRDVKRNVILEAGNISIESIINNV